MGFFWQTILPQLSWSITERSSCLLETVGKKVFSQLRVHLEHNMWHIFWSAYRSRHNRETTLLRVFNDLLIISDFVHISVLTRLDLSAAFDTIDHYLLMDRLKYAFGIRGTALAFFYVICEWKEADCFCSGSWIVAILFVERCSSGLTTRSDPLHPVHTSAI